MNNRKFKSLEEFEEYFFPEKHKNKQFSNGNFELEADLPPKLVAKLKVSLAQV